MVRPFVFGRSERAKAAPILDVIEQVKSMKAAIDDKMAGRGHERRNVKLGIGGIREIEFLVQAVQIIIGRRLPHILDRNTMRALGRFRRYGLLSAEDHAALTRAYVFLRDVEHKLQMVHDLQTHALPERPDELTRCAIRLGYPSHDRHAAMTRFTDDHRHYTAEVHRIFRNLVDAPEQSPLLKAALGIRGRGVS
jgi:glutamate-ammonia-ligase adenylyltransferase